MKTTVKASPILAITLRWLIVQMAIVSIFLLLRGHDEPGGGFSGGLLAASAVIIISITKGTAAGHKLLYFQPLSYIGVGLLLALLAGVLQLGAPFLTAVWVKVPLGFVTLKLGSPMLFDLGVYAVVLGVASSFVLGIESAINPIHSNQEKDVR